MEVNVEVETDEGTTVVEEARELERRLRRAFGDAALTTGIEEEGERVVVTGDGWKFIARGDEVVFVPGGASYRIVRSVGALESVERDDDDVVFDFGDERITLGRGVEHRA
jgi:hypothetical protein